MIRASLTGEYSSHGSVDQGLASGATPDSTEAATAARRGVVGAATRASRFRSVVVLRDQPRGWQGVAEATSQVTFNVASTQSRPCYCLLTSSVHS